MNQTGPRILLIGATYRALCVLERLIERGERVVAFIGQEGGGERDFCAEILELCDRHSIPARSGRKLGEEVVRWLEDRIRPDLAIAVGLGADIPLSVGGNSRLGLIEVVDPFSAEGCDAIVLRQRGQELQRRKLDPVGEHEEVGEVYLDMVDQLVDVIDAHLDQLGASAMRPSAQVSFDPTPCSDDVEARVVLETEPGAETEQLEGAFAKRVGADHVLALDSARHAFLAVFRALGLGEGHEIILPGLCSTAAVDAARETGAKLVFVDVQPESLTLDPERVVEHLSDRTRAIVVSHAFGQPADLATLYAIAEEHGLELIEDAGRSTGARVDGGTIGQSPCTTVFQLPIGVPLPAPAVALITAPDALAAKLEDLPRLGNGAAAAAHAELEILEDTLSLRREQASTYSSELSPYDAFIVPRTPADRMPVYSAYVLRLTHFARTTAEDLQKLLLESGVETRRIALPLRDRELAELPVAEDIVAHSVLLPMHRSITEDQLQIVLDTIFDFAIG